MNNKWDRLLAVKPAPSKKNFDYGLGVVNLNGLLGHGGNLNNCYTSFVGRYHGYDVVILVNGQAGAADGETWSDRAGDVLKKVIKETGL